MSECKHRVRAIGMEGQLVNIMPLGVAIDTRTAKTEQVCVLKVNARNGVYCDYPQANHELCPVAKKFRQARTAGNN